MSNERLATNPYRQGTDNYAIYEASVENFQTQRTQAQKEAEAKALVERLAGSYEGKIFNIDSFEGAIIGGLEVERQRLERDNISGNELSDEQIELAKKYIDSKEFERSVEARLNSYANTELNAIAGNRSIVTATSAGDVKDEVQAELLRQLEAKEISQEEYDFLYQKSKTAGGFWSMFGIKRNKKVGTDAIYNVAANQNNLRTTSDSFGAETPSNKRHTAFLGTVQPELAAKIDARGFMADDLYVIFNENGGFADGTINYSCKAIQPGEYDAILAALNSSAKTGDYKFTKQDVVDIGKALGYNMEKAVDWLRVTGDAMTGGLAGSPVIVGAESTSLANAAGGAIGQSTSTAVLPVGAIAGPFIGAGVSVWRQYRRVEDRAIPDDAFSVNSYDKYARALDDYCTPEAARLGKKIASYYNIDGEFQIAQLTRDLHKAAGTVKADATPLNYEELNGLLQKLQNGEIKPQPPVQKTEEEVYIVSEVIEEDFPVEACEYKIKAGDNPYEIAKGKYGLQDGPVAVKVAKYIYNTLLGGAFPRAGVTIQLPMEIPINVATLTNGSAIKVNCAGSVNAGIIDETAGGRVSNQGNNLGTERVSTSVARVMKKNADGTTEVIDTYNGPDARSQADARARRYQQENATNTHTVIYNQ